MKKVISLCEKCKNKLHLTYMELPFKFDSKTGVQLNTEIQEHYEPCIYLKFRYPSTWEEMLILTCDQYATI